MLGYKHFETRRKLLIISTVVGGFLFTLFALDRHDKLDAVLTTNQPWRKSEAGLQSDLKSLSPKQLTDLANSTLGVRIQFSYCPCLQSELIPD